MTNQHLKNMPRLSRKCELKPQWASIFHPSAWLQRLSTRRICEDVRQQELSYLLLDMQNGTTSLETSLAVSYTVNHALTQRFHSQWYEHICSHRDVDIHLHSQKLIIRPAVHEQMSGYVSCDLSTQWNHILQWKRLPSLHIWQHGGIKKNTKWMKPGIKAHHVWYHLGKNLGQARL